jgi:hypothetical protein
MRFRECLSRTARLLSAELEYGLFLAMALSTNAFTRGEDMDNAPNPWKLTAIGMALVVVTALITTMVVANWSGRSAAPPDAVSASPAMPASATAPTPFAVVAPAQPAPAVPSKVAIDACNRYAATRPSTNDKTVEVVKDGAIGAAIGAAVGAAGGAIADGGKGAGTGAAVGGVVGATGGVLYGLNENKKKDERYRHAYASCMRSRGYAG